MDAIKLLRSYGRKEVLEQLHEGLGFIKMKNRPGRGLIQAT
jgi:hypothetical protein